MLHVVTISNQLYAWSWIVLNGMVCVNVKGKTDGRWKKNFEPGICRDVVTR